MGEEAGLRLGLNPTLFHMTSTWGRHLAGEPASSGLFLPYFYPTRKKPARRQARRYNSGPTGSQPMGAIKEASGEGYPILLEIRAKLL